MFSAASFEKEGVFSCKFLELREPDSKKGVFSAASFSGGHSTGCFQLRVYFGALTTENEPFRFEKRIPEGGVFSCEFCISSSLSSGFYSLAIRPIPSLSLYP